MTSYAGRGGQDGNSGISGLVFVAFLGLGILALLGGAIVGGVFDSGPAAVASPSPSLVATPSPVATPETTPTEGAPTPTATASPAPSVVPTAQPDGFLARAEVCAAPPTDSTCNNSGAVNHGDLWVLVSHRHAKATDVIGVTILDNTGAVQDEGSLALYYCGASIDCAGWTYFQFANLDPGNYDVRVSRNGTPVATTSFVVQ